MIGTALFQATFDGDWRAYWRWVALHALPERTRAGLRRGLNRSDGPAPAWLAWTLAVGGELALAAAHARGLETELFEYLDGVVGGESERTLLGLPPKPRSADVSSPRHHHSAMTRRTKSTLAGLDTQIAQLQAQAHAAAEEADRLLGRALRRAMARLNEGERATLMGTLDRVVAHRADRVALGLDARPAKRVATSADQGVPASAPSEPVHATASPAAARRAAPRAAITADGTLGLSI